MDPDVCLQRIRACVDAIAVATHPAIAVEECAELAEAVNDLDEWLTRGGFPPAAWAAGLTAARAGYEAPMTEENAQPQTEVSVEQPAKVTTTTQVDATPETAGAATPDEVTETLEVEPKE